VSRPDGYPLHSLAELMNLKTFANLEVDEYSSECSWTCAFWIRCNWDYTVMGVGETGSLDLKAKKHEWVKTLPAKSSTGIRRTGRREWVTLQQPSGMRRKGRRVINWQAGRDELSRQSGRALRPKTDFLGNA
jgi:hypothetical protein